MSVWTKFPHARKIHTRFEHKILFRRDFHIHFHYTDFTIISMASPPTIYPSPSAAHWPSLSLSLHSLSHQTYFNLPSPIRSPWPHYLLNVSLTKLNSFLHLTPFFTQYIPSILTPMQGIFNTTALFQKHHIKEMDNGKIVTISTENRT